VDIAATRQIVRAAIEGKLEKTETRKDPFFGLNVPAEIEGVPKGILDPRETWDDKDAYDEQAKKLADLFRENFKVFEGEVDEKIREAGPNASQ
jgi:phosphoenolpyruvate carboxykinase (ATP)